jgi:3-deoxy-D-manno-octulosonate 8-phosphate phosphatase (KDO 8-P phosphatase)
MDLSKFKYISTFIFDVDGVLTDGSVLCTLEGNMLRTMNIKDGYAIQHAVKSDYRIIIISGGHSDGVVIRLKGLGVEDIHTRIKEKKELLASLQEKYGLKSEECLYMGDDVPDTAAMKLCYVITCPNDAATDVKEIAHYVSPLNGGKGCVRDVIEKVMLIQDKWHNESSVIW